MVGEKHTHTHAPAYRHKHTDVNAHKHTVLIFSAASSLSHEHSKTSLHTHTHTQKISQYLIQLANARGEAEVIIMSVFNSSVTGWCCFSVSKEHLNKQVWIIQDWAWFAHAGCPHPLSSSHAGISLGQEWDKGKKKKKEKYPPSRCKESKHSLSQAGVLLFDQCS